jgi:hypothetical protein
VFVQVHNRGVRAAQNVAVKVFVAASAITLPDLPAGFWSGFPSNVLSPASPWQQIGPHKVAPRVDPGRSEIVSFDWTVSGSVPSAVSLLAIISADNDSIASTELNIAALVTGEKKCGLSNMTVLNPPPVVGPPVRSIHLDVGGSSSAPTTALEMDRASASMIRAVVLSKRLSRIAKKSRLKSVRLRADEKEELARLFQTDPGLRRRLDMERAYRPQPGSILKDIQLKKGSTEPVVLLLDPKPRRRYGSIVQRTSDGTVVGGYTLQTISNRSMG